MSILVWLILGLIAGFIASKIVNKNGSGPMLDIVLGIVGAVVGGFLFSLIGAAPVTGLNIYSVVVAIIGAIVVLWIYHAITGRQAVCDNALWELLLPSQPQKPSYFPHRQSLAWHLDPLLLGKRSNLPSVEDRQRQPKSTVIPGMIGITGIDDRDPPECMIGIERIG